MRTVLAFAIAAAGLLPIAGHAEDTPPRGGFLIPQTAIVAVPLGVLVNWATINGDVDLYDAPGGAGDVIGMLTEGSTTVLVHCQSDNWCQVNEGWVWGDFIDR